MKLHVSMKTASLDGRTETERKTEIDIPAAKVTQLAGIEGPSRAGVYQLALAQAIAAMPPSDEPITMLWISKRWEPADELPKQAAAVDLTTRPGLVAEPQE